MLTASSVCFFPRVVSGLGPVPGGGSVAGWAQQGLNAPRVTPTVQGRSRWIPASLCLSGTILKCTSHGLSKVPSGVGPQLPTVVTCLLVCSLLLHLYFLSHASTPLLRPLGSHLKGSVHPNPSFSLCLWGKHGPWMPLSHACSWH